MDWNTAGHYAYFFPSIFPDILLNFASPQETLRSSFDRWTPSVLSSCWGVWLAGSGGSHCLSVSSCSVSPPCPASAAAAVPPPSETGASSYIPTRRPAYTSLSPPAIACTHQCSSMPVRSCPCTCMHTYTHNVSNRNTPRTYTLYWRGG